MKNEFTIPIINKLSLLLYIPTITLRKNYKGLGFCYGIWAKTATVFRTDGCGYYRWGFALQVFGFGIGLKSTQKPKED